MRKIDITDIVFLLNRALTNSQGDNLHWHIQRLIEGLKKVSDDE